MHAKTWVIAPLRWSHHPKCSYFEDHVFIIRGRKFCRGCTCFYPSLLISLLVSVVFQVYSLESYLLIPLLTLMLVPTLLSFRFTFPRLLKDMNKSLLGINTGLAFAVILLNPDLLVKAIVIVVLVPSAWYVEKRRERKNLAVCESCPQFEQMFTYSCDGYREVGDRMQISRVVSQSTIPDPLSQSSEKGGTSFDDL